MEQQVASIHDSETLVRNYLDAVRQRDLHRCTEFYAEDATITMLYATYHGRSAIEEWHKDRFAAELSLIQLNQVRVRKDIVTIDAVVTSSRLQSLKINSLRGTGTFKVEDGKFKQSSFKPKMYNPLEDWGNR